ncbi:MAG: hypothetical protein PHU75_03820 [Candidatus Nanopelagicales bacterium]|nr:hypothetical protein [Candidatus Nanopelagicales bacterium]
MTLAIAALVASLAANCTLVALLYQRDVANKRLQASGIVTRQLAAELERKLGPRKAARLIRAATVQITQRAALGG